MMSYFPLISSIKRNEHVRSQMTSYQLLSIRRINQRKVNHHMKTNY